MRLFKKYIFAILLINVGLAAAAQKSDIPLFKLWRTNGQLLTAASLPKKPLVLVYFDPDCGHCITLINGIFKEKAAFKNTTLLLATFKPAGELKTFERQYKTATMPNMITATEGSTFFLRYHYNMQKTPFVALFNKEGKLVRRFDNQPVVADLLGPLKTL